MRSSARALFSPWAFGLFFASLLRAGPEPQIISGYQIVSRVEFPGAPPVSLETRPGEPLDTDKVRHDLKTLWQSQRFSDIRAEALPDGNQVRVVFRARERRLQRVEKIHIEPPTPGINPGIAPGAEIDSQIAQQIASGVRKQLVSSGFPDAAVEAKIVPAGSGKVNFDLHVQRNRQVDIADVSFSGDLGVTPSELRRALLTTKSKTIIPGIWRLRPGYSSDAVAVDAANLRSRYYKRGYFDAKIKPDPVDLSIGNTHVTYQIDAGPRYRIRDVHIADRDLAIPPDGRLPADAICKVLFNERRQAERSGVLDFSARMEVHELPEGGSDRVADVRLSIARGPAYQIGRITFQGNHAFSDLTLRRAMLIDEGAPLDEMRLRKSIARLNSMGFFELLTERNVVVNTPPDADRADVTIWLKERKMRSWSFSGPVGPLSTGGPLEFAIGSRLPSWGQGILELSTYAVSLKLMLFAKPIGNLIPFLPNKRFIPLLAIQRPLLPGRPFLSGSEFIPQLGWQGILAGYGAAQARSFFRGIFDSERSYTPDLTVTVVKDGAEQGALACEVSKTKLDRARQIGGLAVNLMFAFLPF